MSQERVPIKIEEDPNLDPEILKLLLVIRKQNRDFGVPPFPTILAEDARKIMDASNPSYKKNKGVEIRCVTIPLFDPPRPTKVYIVRPVNRPEPLPCFLFFKGGGFVVFDFEAHLNGVADLVLLSSTVGVYVETDNAPEWKYPNPVNQACSVTIAIYHYGKDFGIDTTKMALVGASAGCSFALASAMRLKKTPGTDKPIIPLLLLFSPSIDTKNEFSPDSNVKYSEDRFITKTQIDWAHGLYAPKVAPPATDYEFSPITAPAAVLQGLPPTFIMVPTSDPIRDSMLQFGRQLDEAGVPVTLTSYQGTIHMFNVINNIEEVPSVKAGKFHAAQALKRYLSK